MGGDAVMGRESLLQTQAVLDYADSEYEKYRSQFEDRASTYGDNYQREPENVAVVSAQEDEARREENLISRGFARHIFNDLDDDGSGKIDQRELRRLAALLGEQWDDAKRAEVLRAADRDNDGGVCFEELYAWLRENSPALNRADLFRHTPGMVLGTLKPEWKATLRVMEMGDAHCASISVSRPTLIGHLCSTYQTLQEWGNPQHVCVAGLFHSAYDPTPAHTALRPRQDREVLARLLGADAEELAWLFDSANKITPDGAGGAGIWDAPPRADCCRIIDPLPCRVGDPPPENPWLRVSRTTRGQLAELCLANLFDSVQAEGAEWYPGFVAVRFMDVKPLLSKAAQGVVDRCQQRMPRIPFAQWAAQCPAILKWRHLAKNGATPERRRRADDTAALLERRYEALAQGWIGS